MLMIFGEKNVEKTLTQQAAHFAQGGTSLSNGMTVARGNSFTAGTSM